MFTGIGLEDTGDANALDRADGRWLTLTNALSGLFCASLNFIDSTRTTRPVMSFEPRGDHSEASLQNLHLLHGTLPREVVCTENLTPFLKLLPCKGKAGISSLLDGHKLFDASWQSMSVDVRPIEGGLEITQTIDMVLDIQRSKRPRGTLYTTAMCRAMLTLRQTTQSHDQFHITNSSVIPQSLTTLTTRVSRSTKHRVRTGLYPRYSDTH